MLTCIVSNAHIMYIKVSDRILYQMIIYDASNHPRCRQPRNMPDRRTEISGNPRYSSRKIGFMCKTEFPQAICLYIVVMRELDDVVGGYCYCDNIAMS